MKALKKILSALPALAILCILVVPAAAPAEDGVISGQQGGGSGSAYGEGIKGGTTTFQKHLILPAENRECGQQQYRPGGGLHAARCRSG